MSFNKYIEDAIARDKLEYLRAIVFDDIIVEPIPTCKEYIARLSGKERRIFVDASVKQWAYHKMRLG